MDLASILTVTINKKYIYLCLDYPHVGSCGVGSAVLSHPVSKNKTWLVICVPRKSTHTTTEAIISKIMLYSGNILINNTYIRES